MRPIQTASALAHVWPDRKISTVPTPLQSAPSVVNPSPIIVTTLIVPGLNDDLLELNDLAAFIVQDLGPETPWHISRFHPTYKLTDRPSTPIQTLTTAREIGLNAGLRYVYTGNVPGNTAENTFCYSCGETVIERWGFQVENLRLKNGKCPQCGVEIDGVWE